MISEIFARGLVTHFSFQCCKRNLYGKEEFGAFCEILKNAMESWTKIRAKMDPMYIGLLISLKEQLSFEVQ